MIERTLNSLAGDDVDAALRRIWELAGDTFKYYYRHDSLDDFIADAKQTSSEFATSFYGTAITGKRWTVLRPFAVAGGPDGWIGTCVVETVARDDRKRKWCAASVLAAAMAWGVDTPSTRLVTPAQDLGTAQEKAATAHGRVVHRVHRVERRRRHIRCRLTLYLFTQLGGTPRRPRTP